MHLILLLVVLMTMSASAWTPEAMCKTKYPAVPCRVNYGPGWYQMGKNRCVKAFPKLQRSHREAEAECLKYKNGDLVSIHNVQELCHVECAMWRTLNIKYHYWIGLRKHPGGFSQSFYWTDGTPYDFSHYARGQPDIDVFRRELCVEMNYAGWGLWNDEICGMRRGVMCAVKLN